ncbi:hypothetical protein [Streptomyces sp. CC77]|uniref:hypothetical protein n=1 Tax=Streptomyces sp. CC77 TaxID=1906739 RepID=UPI0008DC6C1A|nr:hypothetical protein [Streptomyces sp. CC77]OII68297.1 hypothetical protein BJP39_00625 [Streptomyces sp. CC77]
MNHDATYEFPEGELYVTILPAVTKHERWGDQDLALPEGRLGISSSRDENDEPGFVKIRGRRYRIASRRERAHVRREGLLRRNDSDASLWIYQSPLRRWEFTNDRDQELSHGTAARERLNRMVREAADRFEAEHPGWQLISERLELEGLLSNAKVGVATAREDLAKAEAHVTRLAARLSALTA